MKLGDNNFKNSVSDTNLKPVDSFPSFYTEDTESLIKCSVCGETPENYLGLQC